MPQDREEIVRAKVKGGGEGREERGSKVVTGAKETNSDVYKRTRRDDCGWRQEHKMVQAGTEMRVQSGRLLRKWRGVAWQGL